MYLRFHTCTHMCEKMINIKKPLWFKRDKIGVYGGVKREEKERGSDLIMVKS